MNEYRFEDMSVGMREEFEIAVTDDMISKFADISGDRNPLHIDPRYARKAGYKGAVVYGLLSTSLFSRMGGQLLPGKYCLIQGVEARYPKPVYAGDKLKVVGRVAEVNDTVRNAVIAITIFNQDGMKVVRGRMQVGFLELNN